ncbi:hypothetical protein [Rheinheimera pleomorphica]|nr:hypothetical protein [Rheinheimera pleomorphica]
MTKTSTTANTGLPKPVWFLLLYLAGLAGLSLLALLLKAALTLL